jgi:hypothetical protein
MGVHPNPKPHARRPDSRLHRREAVRDLHKLTRTEGHAAVAAALGMSERTLKNARSGATALNVDDLYQLTQRFPDFDLLGTVTRIGLVRAMAGKGKVAP